MSASGEAMESRMRNAIRAELEMIEPHDSLEQEHLVEALAWVNSGVELCRISKPATPPVHLVSYFAVVDGDHILLVDHRNAQLWLPTGGHVEPGEHPRDTVIRELKEELSLVPTGPVGAPLMVTCTTTVGLAAGHRDVSLWYVVEASRQQPITFDEQEFSSIRWFRFSEVPFERSDPQMRRFVEKLGSLRKLPVITDGNPLLGTWKLKSHVVTTAAGERSTPYGESPTGYLSYSADGRMQVIGAASGRTVPTNPTPPDNERVALHDTMFAYAGTYSIEAGKVIHHVDISWNEVWTGTDQIRLFEVNGSTLTLTTHLTDPASDTEVHYAVVWEKVASPR
jgi:8-oxo-dGTP diphosphatase